MLPTFLSRDISCHLVASSPTVGGGMGEESLDDSYLKQKCIIGFITQTTDKMPNPSYGKICYKMCLSLPWSLTVFVWCLLLKQKQLLC